jgi:hypothetical protein
MTVHQAALLAGLFLPPLVALALGHRIARRPPRTRTLFWGVVIGHTLAALLATVAALYAPVRWDEANLWRGLLGFWSMPIGGALGAAAGWMLGGRRA